MNSEIALVTYSGLKGHHPHDAPLLNALRQKGRKVSVVAWDDLRFDWSRPALCVIRSTWDYHHRIADFLKWTDRIGKIGRLWNSPEVVRWNSHKSYLRELEVNGISVVPTEWVPRNSREKLATILRRRGWREAVIKPAVSAAAANTFLISDPVLEESEVRFSGMNEAHDVLVQPFMKTLHAQGERSLIYLGGTLSHGVHRAAGLSNPGDFPGEIWRIEPTAEEVQFADAVFRAAPHQLHYARLDLVQDERGKMMLLELEAIEPGMFFHLAPDAAERFADLIGTAADTPVAPKRAVT